jgi:hypothetical protein
VDKAGKVSESTTEIDMSNESKALDLADYFEQFRTSSHRTADKEPLHLAAAAELRRQHAEIESLRAQLAARVPDGWKLVPVEPTKEMLDAYVNNAGCFQSARSDWAAMLSAAPSQQAPVQGEPVAAAAWAQGYRQGIDDERASEANIGIAGFGAKVEPARQNPYTYTTTQQASKPMTWDEVKKTIRDAHHIAWSKYGRMASDEEICRAVERHHKIGEKR